MKNVNLPYLCKTLANLSGIPTRVYHGDELTFYSSVVSLPKDPIILFKNELWAIKDHIGYFITPRFFLYGIVYSGDTRIIVGPTAQIPANEQSLRELAFLCDVPKEAVPEFVDGMKSIITMPLESLLMMLCPINYILNDEELEIKDITISKNEQEVIKRPMGKKRPEIVYEMERHQALHNTLALEEALMDILRKGDTEALRVWIDTAPAIRGGVLAVDQLRQLKNTFIVIATLASRSAIRGGMDVDDAFSLSDAYIRRCELLTSQGQIMNLQYNMILEYAEQVQKIRRGKTPSKLQTEVANYVQHHLSEQISTETMAKEFFLSRAHFSTKFKAETGITLTDFILNEKTEEAKHLLRYSNKSLSAISAYLGFSSLSHFTRVFKKYSDITPKEYRDRHSY
jgi:AraC-like DNA-binding protein